MGRASVASFKRSVESTPPENATATFPSRTPRRISIAVSRFASRPPISKFYRNMLAEALFHALQQDRDRRLGRDPPRRRRREQARRAVRDGCARAETRRDRARRREGGPGGREHLGGPDV